MELLFENHKNGNGGYISLQNPLEEMGRLTYTLTAPDQTLIISYVMVFPKFEGQGYGKRLVEEAIQFARINRWKVTPHCSYARAVMMRMPDVEDVFTP